MSCTAITHGMKLVITTDGLALEPPLEGCRVVSYSQTKWHDLQVVLLWNAVSTGSAAGVSKIMNGLKSGALTILDGMIHPPFQTEVRLELRLGVDCLRDDRPTPTESQWNGFSSMKTAPKDGSLVQLKAINGEHQLVDVTGPYLTVGFNQCEDTGEDFWHVMGWCWSHDCITQNTGMKILGWKPFSP